MAFLVCERANHCPNVPFYLNTYATRMHEEKEKKKNDELTVEFQLLFAMLLKK